MTIAAKSLHAFITTTDYLCKIIQKEKQYSNEERAYIIQKASQDIIFLLSYM